MARFYVLPSRPHLGRRFGQFLRQLLPGVDCAGREWSDLAEALGAALLTEPDIFLIFREDLPDGDLDANLRRDFGADSGDEIVEVGDVSPPRYWLLN
jgi:hypothetical protein